MDIYEVGQSGTMGRGWLRKSPLTDRRQRTWKVRCGVAEFMENDGPSCGTKTLSQGLKPV